MYFNTIITPPTSTLPTVSLNLNETMLKASTFEFGENFNDQTLIPDSFCIDIKSLNLLPQQQELNNHLIEASLLSFDPPTLSPEVIGEPTAVNSSFKSIFSTAEEDSNSILDAASLYPSYSCSYAQQQLDNVYADSLQHQAPLLADSYSNIMDNPQQLFQMYDGKMIFSAIEPNFLSIDGTALPLLDPLGSPEEDLFAYCSTFNDMFTSLSFLHNNASTTEMTSLYDDLAQIATSSTSTTINSNEEQIVHPSDAASSSPHDTNTIPTSTVTHPPKATTASSVSSSSVCFTSVFEANPTTSRKRSFLLKSKRRKSSAIFSMTASKLLVLRRRSSFSAYVCNFCSRTFSRKYDVIRHKRIHTGAKPYVCPCCSKRFARSDARMRHFRTEAKCQDGLKTMKRQKKKQQQQQRKNSLKKTI